jgi:heme-degrading monooxygenase HmoA
MDVAAEAELVSQMYEIVSRLPGFVSAKEYRATDGEIIFLVMFETVADLARWRDHPEHVAVKQRWSEFYAGYRIQLAEVTAEYGPGSPSLIT